MKAKKIKKAVKKPVKKAVVLQEQAPLETDEDLRTILNKGDFDKYELDAYLNDLNS
ncbi:hypothetical protein HY639_02470 [Candidatus Woesearchaeota archaeon]|nr:hypothetical protein [Candidatus Woesearchaeota archaeon]